MSDRIQKPDDPFESPNAGSDRGAHSDGAPQGAAPIRSSKKERRNSDGLPDFDQRIYAVQKLSALVEILGEDGVPAVEVLSGSELTPADFSSASTRISYRQMIAVYNNAIRLTKDPTLFFRLGMRMHLTSHGMYGYALLSCRNLDETARFGAKYNMSIGPAFVYTYSLDADWARWVFSPIISQDPLSDLYRFSLEGILAAFLVTSYDLINLPFGISCLRLVYPPPAHASAYEDIFQCPVRFNSDVNEIQVPAPLMARPIACANPIMFELARRACDEILQEIEKSGGYAALVRQALLRIPGLFPPAETIAGGLGVSARQLHRNLQAENTSYRKILDEARMGLAFAYLRKTHMTTEDIAARLGFSDGANFRHAFRRWTGKSTSEFRAGEN
jgi:AraC-like DNA-binding protein